AGQGVAVAGLAAAGAAESVVVRAAVLAGTTGDVLLQAVAVAFLDLPVIGGLFADPGDDAEILVAHDVRASLETLATTGARAKAAQVAPANAASFDFQQRGILREVVLH